MSVIHLPLTMRKRPRPTQPASLSRILPRLNFSGSDWAGCRMWVSAGERLRVRIPDEPLTLFVADFWPANLGVHVVASVWPESHRIPCVFNCGPLGCINAFANAGFVATPVAITDDRRLLLDFETPADTIEVCRLD